MASEAHRDRGARRPRRCHAQWALQPPGQLHRRRAREDPDHRLHEPKMTDRSNMKPSQAHPGARAWSDMTHEREERSDGQHGNEQPSSFAADEPQALALHRTQRVHEAGEQREQRHPYESQIVRQIAHPPVLELEPRARVVPHHVVSDEKDAREPANGIERPDAGRRTHALVGPRPLPETTGTE